jgi:hypothetical protein
VANEAPYLAPADDAPNSVEQFLGRYILEGSKPGAAAAAVWLSHKAIPLDERGYGYLIERTMAGARRLHTELSRADLAPFRLVLLPIPDINIVCYVVCHPSLDTLAALNAFNEHVFQEMSLARKGGAPEYIVTRTRLRSPTYDGAIGPVLESLGVPLEEWKASGPDGLVVLRSTVMDPFLDSSTPGPDHVAGYAGALARACQAVWRDTPA